MREPVGGEGRSVHNWTPGQLLQLTVNRYTERVLDESRHADGFISDGSVVHEWAYAKVRLVTGSYPGTDVPLADRHRSTETAVLEEVADELGLLMKHHAGRTYDAFLHIPIEFPLAPENRPINENFRRLSDAILIPALEATGIPLYTVRGTLAERLEQAGEYLGRPSVSTVDEAARLAEKSTE
ncbi:ATP-binding protein [Streptomyces sodiiphilus]|uniref:ATP-binding protein n=2 Tax=Streptomyces sodiiphilus TaxID=226217 RepID=A0ABN2P1R4_9ACTN